MTMVMRAHMDILHLIETTQVRANACVEQTPFSSRDFNPSLENTTTPVFDWTERTGVTKEEAINV